MVRKESPWLRPELVASWPEITLVLIFTIGLSAARSTWQAIHGSSSHYIVLLLTDRRMIYTIAVEGIVLALLFAFLHQRGWIGADFKVKPGWVGSMQGILLVPFLMLANSITVLGALIISYLGQHSFTHFLPFAAAQSQGLPAHGIHLGWISMGIAITLNAFFEELTCMGYAFNQLAAKRGPLVALIVVILLRMSCHSYQGPVHMLGIGVVFLLEGLVYWRTRNLWPLIVAHALVDGLSATFVKLLHG
jgi:membrane protease YdiL (CAAX protease family)